MMATETSQFEAAQKETGLTTETRPNPSLKVVLLGDSGVGKTCLRSQFVHHVFSNAYKATIGGDYLTTAVDIRAPMSSSSSSSANDGSRDSDSDPVWHPQTVNLQVWDTAGQERFNSISQAFYRGADVAVLVYDITSYESLLSVRTWFSRFMEHCQVENPGIVIVGNKSDRSADRAIDKSEVRDVLCRNGAVHSSSHISNSGPSLLADHVGDWEQDVLEVTCRTLSAVDSVFHRVAEVGLDKSSTKANGRFSTTPAIILEDPQAVSRCAC